MATTATVERPRLKQRYDTAVRAELQEALGLSNPMEVPRLTKIVINMGVGKAITEKKFIEEAVEAMKTIAGQDKEVKLWQRRAKKPPPSPRAPRRSPRPG